MLGKLLKGGNYTREETVLRSTVHTLLLDKCVDSISPTEASVLNEKWGGGQQHLIMTRHLISKWHFYVNLACKSEQLIKIWLQNAHAPGWQCYNLQPNLWTWFKLDRFTHVVLVWQLESVILVEFWKQLCAICHHWIWIVWIRNFRFCFKRLEIPLSRK